RRARDDGPALRADRAAGWRILAGRGPGRREPDDRSRVVPRKLLEFSPREVAGSEHEAAGAEREAAGPRLGRALSAPAALLAFPEFAHCPSDARPEKVVCCACHRAATVACVTFAATVMQ